MLDIRNVHADEVMFSRAEHQAVGSGKVAFWNSVREKCVFYLYLLPSLTAKLGNQCTDKYLWCVKLQFRNVNTYPGVFLRQFLFSLPPERREQKGESTE